MTYTYNDGLASHHDGAGEVSFGVSGAGEFGIERINAMSEHYLGTAATAGDTEAAIEAGLAAFEEYGIFLIFLC